MHFAYESYHPLSHPTYTSRLYLGCKNGLKTHKQTDRQTSKQAQTRTTLNSIIIFSTDYIVVYILVLSDTCYLALPRASEPQTETGVAGRRRPRRSLSASERASDKLERCCLSVRLSVSHLVFPSRTQKFQGLGQKN